MSTVETTTPAARNRRKVRVGKVISNKMQKSIVISLERKVPHPLYKKYYKQTSTLMAHDEKREAGIGDTVKVLNTTSITRSIP
jgi:small subunit ribosomal protein S17